MSGKLKNRFVFISASFPSKEQGVEYLQDFVPMLTMDAVSAISREIFQAGGKIINGGHPTILPFMYSIAEEFKVKRRKDFPLILVYQTEYFRDKQTISSKKLAKNKIGEFIWTPEAEHPSKDENTRRNESLSIMRNKMLSHKDIIAGIFIAGMDGINSEFNAFKETQKDKPYYALGSPGGAAKGIAKALLEDKNSYPNNKYVTAEELFSLDSLPLLASKIVMDIGWRMEGGNLPLSDEKGKSENNSDQIKTENSLHSMNPQDTVLHTMKQGMEKFLIITRSTGAPRVLKMEEQEIISDFALWLLDIKAKPIYQYDERTGASFVTYIAVVYRNWLHKKFDIESKKIRPAASEK